MDNSRKIRLVSRTLEYACYVVAALVVLLQISFSVLMWLAPELAEPLLVAKGVVNAIAEANPTRAVPAWIIYLLPSVAMAYGIYRLGRMFGLFKAGAYFSEPAAAHLIIFSLLGLLVQFVSPVFSGLAGWVAQLGNEHGTVEFNITIDGTELIQLLAWATFLTVAWIIREGMRLQTENAEFI